MRLRPKPYLQGVQKISVDPTASKCLVKWELTSEKLHPIFNVHLQLTVARPKF